MFIRALVSYLNIFIKESIINYNKIFDWWNKDTRFYFK